MCEAVQKPAGEESSPNENYWRHYSKRNFWVPCFLVCWAFVVGSFGGATALQTFAVYIFTELDAPMDKHTATVFLGAGQILGTLSCVILIHFTGKRKLALVSTISTGLCFFIVALYKFMIDRGTIEGQDYAWIPTYVLIGSAYLSHLGIRLLPWILIGEVFTAKARTLFMQS